MLPWIGASIRDYRQRLGRLGFLVSDDFLRSEDRGGWSDAPRKPEVLRR
jgi:hypothetical protein